MKTQAAIASFDNADPVHPAAGLWLVVGEPDEVEAIRRLVPDAWKAEIRRSQSFLAALGELAEHPARVLLAPWSELHDMASHTAGAVQELCPTTSLVVTVDGTDPTAGAAATHAGLPRVLQQPLTLPMLAEALGLVDAPPAGQRSDVIAPLPPSALGDVDLIDAILSGAGLRATALELIRQRCGIPGIAWVEAEADLPPTHAARPVALRGRDFGFLHAPAPASDTALESDLAAWAAWLAHWMTLAEQFTLLKDMSMRDPLTGVWNRRYFDRFLRRILDWAARERSQVTLLVFDIDDFKRYNDRYGHGAGDDILRECARLMQSVVREHDVVARIGGDEFAVIFWDAEGPRKEGSRHPEDVIKAATRFREAIRDHRFPKLLDEAPSTLTISGGLASFPWDGRTPDELLGKADEMALESKRAGKNAIKLGPGVERGYREADDRADDGRSE